MPAQAFDFPPSHFPGSVYGVLLNQRAALAALGDALHQPPYKAPPRAPVLYLKPRNTWVGAGGTIVVPEGIAELEIGATVGLVVGRSLCRVDPADALGHLAGYVIVNDVCVPHANVYRPSLRYRVRDTFCPIGPLQPPSAVADPDQLAIRVSVDGLVVHDTDTGDRVRGAAQLLADVSEFTTLRPGDVLMLGVAAGAPRARAGQHVAIEIEGLGRLENRFIAEVEAAA